MKDNIPDAWYIEHSGEGLILDQDEVSAELYRLHSCLDSVKNWLEQHAGTESDPVRKAALTEAYNAVSAIELRMTTE